MKSKYDNLSGKTNISVEDSINTEESSLVNTIIADAYLKGVSDIQFEPLASQDIIRVLFRIDGVLRQYITAPYSAADDMVKRIKSMANLDIEDIRLPKIGRIIFRHRGLPEFNIMVTLRPNDGQREVATLKIQTT
jgi:type IV pilus assembly protein PilB